MNAKKLIASIGIFMGSYFILEITSSIVYSNGNELVAYTISGIAMFLHPFLAFILGIWTKEGFEISVKRIIASIILWIITCIALLVIIVLINLFLEAEFSLNGETLQNISIHIFEIIVFIIAFCLGLWTKK